MRVYVTKLGDTLPRIIRDTIAASSYRSVPQYRAMLVQINRVDDGSIPVVWDWTVLPAGTKIRLPE